MAGSRREAHGLAGRFDEVPAKSADAFAIPPPDAIPAFADTRQRQAQVVLENEGGKPRQILDVTSWTFDSEGKIDESLRRDLGDWIDVAHDNPSRRRAATATAHVKCSSRKEATVEGRKLLAEKADWLGEDIRLEVNLFSALEWTPID